MPDSTLNICFHGIGRAAQEREPGESHYWVSEQCFYRVLDEIMEWPRVRISFDDGNLSDIQIGLPALLERQLTASFFVLAGRFGRPDSLNEADVYSLRQAGMTIGSHGMDHRSWRRLSAPDRRRELVDARAIVAEAAGAEVTQAALPLGLYDRKLLSQLRTLSYTTVHTSDRRKCSRDSWLQHRFSVTAEDTAHTLRESVLRSPGPINQAASALKGAIKRVR